MSDLLLEWMSFRGQGRLSDLPAELTSAAPRRMLDDLGMLGHLEMTDASAWRIAPPVLACLPEQDDGDAAAILCGARTPGLLGRIESGCLAADARIDRTAFQNRPSLVRISATSTSAIAGAATFAGIPLQYDAAYTLLACLPTIREWPRKPCPMVGGKVEGVLRFSRSRMKWLETSLAEATSAPKGFFRIKRDWDSVSILKSSQSDCAYIEDRAGRLAMAAKLRAASWDSSARTLSFPVQLYPPAVIARALTLCTGTLPQYSSATRQLSFAGIQPAMLRLALAITGLRLA